MIAVSKLLFASDFDIRISNLPARLRSGGGLRHLVMVEIMRIFIVPTLHNIEVSLLELLGDGAGLAISDRSAG